MLDTIGSDGKVVVEVDEADPGTGRTPEVREALLSLPHDYKMVVLLADLEGFAYKEIAEILDVPIGTVMSRLHRGRKAMQRALYEYAEARGLTDPDSRPPGAT